MPETPALRFLGGTGTVTGSKYLVSANCRSVWLDCGRSRRAHGPHRWSGRSGACQGGDTRRVVRARRPGGDSALADRLSTPARTDLRRPRGGASGAESGRGPANAPGVESPSRSGRGDGATGVLRTPGEDLSTNSTGVVAGRRAGRTATCGRRWANTGTWDRGMVPATTAEGWTDRSVGPSTP
jgi:hypothetical protein